MRTTALTPRVLAVPHSQVAADLTAAASLLDVHGLAKGRFCDRRPGEGGLDMTGAIMEAVAPGFWLCPPGDESVYFTDAHGDRFAAALHAVRSFLHLVTVVMPGPPAPLVAWNDAPERTKEQVTTALRGAANWRARGG